MPAFSERHCCGCDCVTVLHKELVIQLVDHGSVFFHRQNLKGKHFIVNVIETRTRTVVSLSQVSALTVQVENSVCYASSLANSYNEPE